MGRRRGLSLIFLLFCSTMAISFAALQQQIFPTEKDAKDEVTNQIGRRSSSSLIAVSNGRGSAAAAAAGGQNGGGSRPHTGGGTAVIPVYAAGSAQARRRQGRPHNAGNRYENNMGLLVAAVLAAIAHLYRVF